MFDAHCHLEDERLSGQIGAVLERARAAGVRGALLAGYDASRWERQAQIAARYDGLHLAVGLHPWAVAALGAAAGNVANIATETGRPSSTVDEAREELFGSVDDVFVERGSVVQDVEVDSETFDESLDSLIDRVETLLGELMSGEV